MVLKELKTTIDARLTKKGLNFKKMALDIGLTQAGAYRMFENGSLKVTVLEEIAKYLNVGVTELLIESYGNTISEPTNQYGGREYIEQTIERIKKKIEDLERQVEHINRRLNDKNV